MKNISWPFVACHPALVSTQDHQYHFSTSRHSKNSIFVYNDVTCSCETKNQAVRLGTTCSLTDRALHHQTGPHCTWKFTVGALQWRKAAFESFPSWLQLISFPAPSLPFLTLFLFSCPLPFLCLMVHPAHRPFVITDYAVYCYLLQSSSCSTPSTLFLA